MGTLLRLPGVRQGLVRPGGAGGAFQWHRHVSVEEDLGGPQLAGVNTDGKFLKGKEGLQWEQVSISPVAVFGDALDTRSAALLGKRGMKG